jgi:hypothetical protein
MALALEGRSAMRWVKPSFKEIRMDAEVSAYVFQLD